MIGAQIYPWMQVFAGRKVQDWRPEALRATAEAGALLWEDMLPDNTGDIEELGVQLEAAGLRSLSIYANATLHTEASDAVTASLVERMKAAAQIGVEILVVNPTPLSWNSLEDKNDEQLQLQTRAMASLGEALQEQGQFLAYHTHHMEMRQAAREFHHTLLNTEEETVGLCLDAHWIYRGAGDSKLALHDIIGLYGDRVRCFHVRQSSQGIWSEVFGEGDLDYRRIAADFEDLIETAPVIIEQATESGTPKTLEPGEALKRSVVYAKEVFG